MCFFFMPRRCKFAKPLAKLRKNEGRTKQTGLFFIPSVIMFAIIKMAKAHYYNMKHSFFSLFFILFEGTSKKTAKKFARFQKTFYLCTRIQNKCIIASVAQLVRAPDC